MPLLTFTQTFMISLFQSMKFKLTVMMKGKYNYINAMVFFKR